MSMQCAQGVLLFLVRFNNSAQFEIYLLLIIWHHINSGLKSVNKLRHSSSINRVQNSQLMAPLVVMICEGIFGLKSSDGAVILV